MVNGKQKEIKAKLTDIVQPGDTIIVPREVLLGPLTDHEALVMKTPDRRRRRRPAGTHVADETAPDGLRPRALQAAMDRAAGVSHRLRRRRRQRAAADAGLSRARAQLLIENGHAEGRDDSIRCSSRDGCYDDDFYQTQYRILQSRSLAKRTIDAMKLWDAPRLGNGPEPKASISVTGLALGGASSPRSSSRKKPFEQATSRRRRSRRAGERPDRGTSETRRAVGAHRRVPGRPVGSRRSATAASSRSATPRPIPSSPPHAANARGQGVHRAEHGVQVQRVEGRGRLARRIV